MFENFEKNVWRCVLHDIGGMSHFTAPRAMSRTLRKVWPVNRPVPTLWWTTLDAFSVKQITLQDIRKRFCTKEQAEFMWQWFLYFCDRRHTMPTNMRTPSECDSTNWKSYSYTYNINKDMEDYDRKGYFTIIVLILNDGIACMTSCESLNWFLNLSRVGKFSLREGSFSLTPPCIQPTATT